MPTEGVLLSGKKWHVIISRKKSPGLEQGEHYILALCDEKVRVEDLTLKELKELSAVAFDFAFEITHGTMRCRIAWSGSGISTRPHPHFHIMVIEEGDKLPPLVQR